MGGLVGIGIVGKLLLDGVGGIFRFFCCFWVVFCCLIIFSDCLI